MHKLQPKHIKLKKEEAEKLLSELNVSLTQLPKIRITDPTLPEDCEISDIVKIERTEENSEGEKQIQVYYRAVSV